jgi:putative endonuclease
MRALGDDLENRAARMLEREGLVLLARNFRGKPGEIDIIARDGNQLVFVEVRGRGNPRYETAAGSVHRHKQRRIIRTAQLFLQRHPRFANLPCRFDVVAFEPPQSGVDCRVRWIRAAFTA